jgi:hypothetical protein
MTPLIDGEADVQAAEQITLASRFHYPEAPRAGLFDNWKAFARGDHASTGQGERQARWRALRSRYPASIANRLEPRLKAG